MVKQVGNKAYQGIVFGTDDNSFHVTATLIVKGVRAFLFNAGFTASTAKEITAYLQDNSLKLEGVFILHGDPDYYFGLEQIVRAFPDVVAYATKETVAHIAESVVGKLDVWSGQLKDEAPKNVVLPKANEGDIIDVLGETFRIVGEDSSRTSLWDEKNKTLIGGIDVFNETHLFLADTGSTELLRQWADRLKSLKKLGAEIVIPSHGDLKGSFDGKALDATEQYLEYAIVALADSKTSGELTEKLFGKYPDYTNKGVVELGAKVLTGEISWG